MHNLVCYQTWSDIKEHRVIQKHVPVESVLNIFTLMHRITKKCVNITLRLLEEMIMEHGCLFKLNICYLICQGEKSYLGETQQIKKLKLKKPTNIVIFQPKVLVTSTPILTSSTISNSPHDIYETIFSLCSLRTSQSQTYSSFHVWVSRFIFSWLPI